MGSTPYPQPIARERRELTPPIHLSHFAGQDSDLFLGAVWIINHIEARGELRKHGNKHRLAIHSSFNHMCE